MVLVKVSQSILATEHGCGTTSLIHNISVMLVPAYKHTKTNVHSAVGKLLHKAKYSFS